MIHISQPSAFSDTCEIQFDKTVFNTHNIQRNFNIRDTCSQEDCCPADEVP